MRFQKRVLFQPGSYDVQVELSITNEDSEKVGRRASCSRPEIVAARVGDQFYIEPEAVAAVASPVRNREKPSSRTSRATMGAAP